MSTTYIVDGMTCSHCSQAVTNALKSIDDDAEISIDLTTKKVTINGLDNEDQIKEAIEDAGFDFMGKA
ncbi:heavy-metal-associated domain-containing protein [Terasakiella sp. A23]|uniref:heavy-metal-associated domain-containing protein n=1 Tax=Terasakiella sp. FCG-A23 TaxID=3080561 RepID=UPI002953F682|nr:heavy-metal-associated domain-containing protein [Terasakiella sp. A23]MDV7338892.1 heavy-metal-associated domain-containing protein [Terasakiella sp. A23]